MSGQAEVRRGETAEAAMARVKKFCPQCVEAGQKSTITVGLSSVPAIWTGNGTYDEDGNFHPPERVKCTTEYRCSKGHKWKETV